MGIIVDIFLYIVYNFVELYFNPHPKLWGEWIN